MEKDPVDSSAFGRSADAEAQVADRRAAEAGLHRRQDVALAALEAVVDGGLKHLARWDGISRKPGPLPGE